jgi:DHA1 family multidrug resistance protein-like MFS transporter
VAEQSQASDPGYKEWTSPRRRFSPFVALCAVGPLTPVYAKYLGAPDQIIGLLVAAVTITGIVVKLPAGALSDILGFRRMMITGALVKATGPFFYLLALSWPWLLVVRFYHGLATAIYAPPASALVARVYPKERGYRLGLYNGSENAGIVLGPVVGGALLSLTASRFPVVFLISGAIGTLSLIVMLRVPDVPAVRAPDFSGALGSRRHGETLRNVGNGIRTIIADPQIRLISLVEAMLWMGIGSVQAYLPLYAITIHLPVWQIGTLAGAQGVASIWSRPIMGRRSDRLRSRKSLIVVGSLLCIATLIAIPYTSGYGLLLGLSIIFGLGTGIVAPSTMAMIGDIVQKKGDFGSAMGVFGSLWDTGHASGPVVFGFLLVSFGYRASWLIMALVMTAALIVFLGGTRCSTSIS